MNTQRANQILSKLNLFLISRAANGAPYSSEDVEIVLEELRPGLVSRLVAGLASGKIKGGVLDSAPAHASADRSPEKRKPAARTRANLDAMRVLAGKMSGFTQDDLDALAGYSGWGGLSIEKVKDWPDGIERPERRGLIHEYYTPQLVCDEVVRVLSPEIAKLRPGGTDIRVLEPSAGIGRFLDALQHGGVNSEIQAIEYSKVSARLVAARFDNASVFQGPFEEWVSTNPTERFDLVLANPPYGARGPAKSQDRAKSYRRKDDGTSTKAYAYFLRRALDTLRKGGIGAFIVPAGFMTGSGATLTKLREHILRRHHLMTAYRLPSGLFPGAMLVTDLLIFRARGGLLPAVLNSDKAVYEGKFFRNNPDNILGVEVGRDGGEDNQTKKPRWGYEVKGTFKSLPSLNERPLDGEEKVVLDGAPTAPTKKRQTFRRRKQQMTDSLSPMAQEAIALALRSEKVLSGQYEGWGELKRDLLSWAVRHGNPHQSMELADLSTNGQLDVDRFLALFLKEGTLSKAFDNKPVAQTRFKGDASDPVAVATHLYKDARGSLTVGAFGEGWSRLSAGRSGEARGLASKLTQALDALCKKGWAIDPVGTKRRHWRLYTKKDYYTGWLWPRVDSLEAFEQKYGKREPWVAKQKKRLLETIGNEPLDEIDYSPQDGWVPVELVEGWLADKVAGSYGTGKILPPTVLKLEKEKNSWTLKGVPYAEMMKQDRALRVCLGWINFDRGMFRPPKTKEEDIEKKRSEQIESWMESWRMWVMSEPERIDAIQEAYDRQMRGYIPVTYTDQHIPVSRWDDSKIKLHWYQARSVQRLAAQRGGVLALDVGLGKTFTGIYSMALARQEGWASRPVVVVPNSLILKWEKDIKNVLPDYRVVMIGVNKSMRGGKVTSSTDSAIDRGRKWTEFQAGAYDVALVTFSMLGTTQVSEKTVEAYADEMVELEFEARSEMLEAEKAREKIRNAKSGKTPKPLTERQKAILEEGTLGWISQIMEISGERAYDEGITWDAIGVDFLMIDEGQNYKNLFMAKAREGGGVPKFMGGGQSSARAWHLHLRSWTVQRRTGGAGVVVLSATPAKNSPLEFYSLTHFTNPQMWRDMGIRHSEQFVERYIDIKSKLIVKPDGTYAQQAFAKGFKNLHELRGAIERECEFRTADEVGLEIPAAEVKLEVIDLTAGAASVYEAMRAEYEEVSQRPGESEKGRLLSLLTGMSMVTVHPTLVDMQDKRPGARRDSPSKVFRRATAMTAGFESDKFRQCALNVIKNRDCAHVIFVEYVAAHAWLKKTLVKYGIEPERIAMLNAVTAPKPSQRQAIAEALNGNTKEGIKPKYDIIIANAVAYEGVDLQKRTCALHHIDLPYEPATLQQRNGRGVRQGNEYVNAKGKSVVQVYYYLAADSVDIWRQDIIASKRSWLIELVKGQDRATNNPADSDADSNALLVMMSSDKEGAKRRLAMLEKVAQASRQADEAKAAVKKFRAAMLSLRSAAAAKPERKDMHLATARRLFDGLEKNETWPYKHLHKLLKSGHPAWCTFNLTKPTEEDEKKAKLGVPFTPEHSFSLMVEGIKARSLDQEGSDRFMGRVSIEGVWVYRADIARWTLRNPAPAPRGYSAFFGFEGLQSPKVLPTAEDYLNALRAGGIYDANLMSVGKAGWNQAPDDWITAVWKLVGPHLVRESEYLNVYQGMKVPVLRLVGGVKKLTIERETKWSVHFQFQEVIPPTLAGWKMFLQHAHTADNETATSLRQAAQFWWARQTPPGLVNGPVQYKPEYASL